MHIEMLPAAVRVRPDKQLALILNYASSIRRLTDGTDERLSCAVGERDCPAADTVIHRSSIVGTAEWFRRLAAFIFMALATNGANVLSAVSAPQLSVKCLVTHVGSTSLDDIDPIWVPAGQHISSFAHDGRPDHYSGPIVLAATETDRVAPLAYRAQVIDLLTLLCGNYRFPQIPVRFMPALNTM